MSAASEATRPRVVRVDDITPQRWRNGGGWTRELFVAPGGDWRVRVSVADIETDGPFSSFPGVQRYFAVLQGAGVELTTDGQPYRVRQDDDALPFAGDARTECRLLAGPTRDLNLMVRTGHGAMVRVVPGQAWQPQAVSCGLFAMAAGTCRADDAPIPLTGFSLLWFEHAPVALTFDSAGWWIAA